jgi:hypothetical protein
MMMKSKYLLILCSLAILVSWSAAVVSEDQPQQTHVIELEFKPSFPQSANSFFNPRQTEFFDDFERDSLWWPHIPWTTSGYIWDIRDTTDIYGPDTAPSGYRYVGVPATDVAQYTGDQTGYLTAILTGPWPESSVYISWDYWSSFEGAATNFDGGIIEISNDGGATWVQIDSLAQGHLNPTYDEQLAGTGPLGTVWAYCYSTDPDWVSVSSQDLIALGYAGINDVIGIRVTFASDPVAAGQGWFIDNARMADTPPPDLQPPIINHIPLSDTTDTLNDYTISATITDEGSGIDTDSVYLHYQIESGPVIDLQMTDMGSDVYEADIPAQVYHTDIFYNITAVDLAGNEGSTPIYNFEVTNARIIIYDDGQPWLEPGVNNPGDGSFVQFSFSDVGIDSGLLHQVKILFDRAGEFDLCIYTGTTGNPGVLIDSMAGLMSPGYQWHTIDITDLDIHMRGEEPVVGFISGPDTVGCIRDEVLNYGSRMWDYFAGAWSNGSGGDHMIRLKVIPMDLGIEENPGEPVSCFALGQIAPNPMRKNAMIEYQLATGQKVCLNIYDVSGQLIKKLVDHYEPAGSHTVIWNSQDERGNSVASGIYFLQFKAGDFSTTQKLLLLK